MNTHTKKNDSTWKIGLNAIFILYIILFVVLTLLFFVTGFNALMQRTSQDLAGIQSNPLHTYASNPQLFAAITSTPLFIVTSIELVIWVSLMVFGLLDKHENMFFIQVLYFMVMGLMIWYYSIL